MCNIIHKKEKTKDVKLPKRNILALMINVL